MNKEAYEIRYPLDAVPLRKFAELIGKTETAVKNMVEDGKLPLIPWKNPDNPAPRRGEQWVFLPEFNRAMHDAFANRPKEQRDAWLLWLGL
ncbi:Cox family DNA-binding protein [Acerihabitans arboris]|uniref:Regulatory protein Cox n=1 Tax=Acerihabitans arboris TaxID=2691583 RepID=A0A845SLE0_9GAMM|nr:Cox family DNA-binding protein [Acerihabitans arboris]NDL64809.1 hypothetical protein [Acerihabitans arboris]